MFERCSVRHALRLGVATAIAGLIASASHLVRGYWIPMTVVIVLKPNFGGTWNARYNESSARFKGAGGSGAAFGVNESMVVISYSGCSCFRHVRSEEPQLHSVSLALTPMVMLMLDIALPISVTDSFLDCASNE